MLLSQAYAVSFFLIPLTRWLLNQRRNTAIEAENDARRSALARLRLPDDQLTAKLASASQRAERRIIRDEVGFQSQQATALRFPTESLPPIHNANQFD